jgi:hypothetical protein
LRIRIEEYDKNQIDPITLDYQGRRNQNGSSNWSDLRIVEEQIISEDIEKNMVNNH